MGEVLNYKDLPIVQRAFELVREVDIFVQLLPRTPQGRNVADQLFRAAASIGANVAEGRGRDTGREYVRYLRIARASANETDYWLHIAHDCQLVVDEDYDRMLKLTDECLRMLSAMIGKLKQSHETPLRETAEGYVTDNEDSKL